MGLLIVVVLVVTAAWYAHVRLYPWRPCPRCGGSRRNVSGYAHRDCGRCDSTGRVRRIGAGRER